MGAQPIVIVGTGGSGRETLALLLDIERARPGSWRFMGFAAMDEPDHDLLRRLKAPFLGDPRTLAERIPEARDWCYSLGIGTPEHLRVMETTMGDQGHTPASRVHPNVLVGPQGNANTAAAAIRTIFAQPDLEHVHEQFKVIATMLGRQAPEVEAMMRHAKKDLLAFTRFPRAHRRQIWSTNPFNRVNKEIKRRTDVVRVFPNP